MNGIERPTAYGEAGAYPSTVYGASSQPGYNGALLASAFYGPTAAAQTPAPVASSHQAYAAMMYPTHTMSLTPQAQHTVSSAYVEMPAPRSSPMADSSPAAQYVAPGVPSLQQEESGATVNRPRP